MSDKAVWKYPVPMTDEFTIDMPLGASILSFQVQGNSPCVWALVQPKASPHPRYFRLAGTGHPIDPLGNYRFIGTIQLHDGALIFHLFERL